MSSAGQIDDSPPFRAAAETPAVTPPDRPRWRAFLDRPAARYAIAIALVTAAVLAMGEAQRLAEKPLAFPFYAAVVISAWVGTGPGVVAVILSTVAVQYYWAEPKFSLLVGVDDLPWFASFIICSLVAFAWSAQRRRAQSALEDTVEQRTADLRQSNAALQVEVAERAAAEQALRDAEGELARTLRLATMAELAAAIAHEINQPLAAITANGSACLRSLAKEPPLLDNAREAAGCIVADGHRAGDVIARIRALFNKEPPKQLLLDINGIVQHVLALSRRAIDRARVTASTELAASPLMVLGDPVQLQQVMVNLVTNALEAMSGIAGRPLRLVIRSEIGADGMAVVTVEDSGRGLDPDQASRIFDSFYTTKPDGIGVGLAISRSIIEAHGGTMWADPERRQGARVGFTLPLATAGE
jgi:C4-dicarboxylate-specific signal transduction histidine kinase